MGVVEPAAAAAAGRGGNDWSDGWASRGGRSDRYDSRAWVIIFRAIGLVLVLGLVDREEEGKASEIMVGARDARRD